MNYIGEIISGIFAVIVVWIEVRASRDRKRTEECAAIRAKESKLAMKMQDANLSLSLATAVAVERGELNGEMKTAREKARTAQEEYDDFVHELESGAWQSPSRSINHKAFMAASANTFG